MSRANLTFKQGTTFSTTLNLTDENGDALNLSGMTAASQIKRWYTSSAFVSMTASVNAGAGTITLSLTANQTSAMQAGRYVYDLMLTDSANNVSDIADGIVTISPAVTNETLEATTNAVSYENYFSNTG